MLRVTIEIVPFGSEEEKRTLSTINIINDGTGTSKYGNYIARRHFWGEDKEPIDINILKYKRDHGYFKLIQKIINKFVRLDND